MNNMELKNKLQLPVIGAPLFIVSNPKLVIEQCKAGIVGSFPALNARPKELLDDWLIEIKEELEKYNNANPDKPAAPFAINQIVHKTNDRIEHDMELTVKHKVPVVITSLGARPEVYDAVHSYGGLVLHDIINNFFAKKAIEKGADGLIAVGSGAGGHAGTLSPFALVREVREFFDGPLALSGSISEGSSVLSALALGADFAYVGTKFIATEEANASPGYKQMIIDSTADDIMYSATFTGVNGNYLRPSVEAAGLNPDEHMSGSKDDMNFSTSAIAKKDNSSKAWKDIWGSGQGIGSIKNAPSVEDAVNQMVSEYDDAKSRLESF